MGFSMEVPPLVSVKEEVTTSLGVTPESVQALVVQSEQGKQVDPLVAQAQGIATSIMQSDFTETAKRNEVLKPIEAFGLSTMQTSQQKNTLMQTSIGKLSASGSEGSEVSKSLLELNDKMQDLDPGELDFTKKGFLGELFNPVRKYFQRFETADSFIEKIIQKLAEGQKTLRQDNVALGVAKDELREVTIKLKREIEMGTIIDNSITEQVARAKVDGIDPEHIRFVEEEILFPLRQRVMDMQTLIAVNQQGVIAMEIVIRNNRELIRGVDRARMVTVTALRTAVMVAAALYDQKIVLDSINALNQTTGNLIAGTAKMLKDQSVEISKQATQATIDPAVLKQAFADVFEATESISTFKQNSLPLMQQQIQEYSQLASEGEKYLTRIDKAQRYSLTEQAQGEN